MVSRQHEEHLDMRRSRSKMFGSIGINSRKNNYMRSGKEYTNTSNSNHVVVKITNGAKSINTMQRNFDYDTK